MRRYFLSLDGAVELAVVVDLDSEVDDELDEESLDFDSAFVSDFDSPSDLGREPPLPDLA